MKSRKSKYSSAADIKDSPGMVRKRGFIFLILFLLVILMILFFLSFLVGTYPISACTVWDVLRSRVMHVTVYWESAVEKVVFQVRIPRIILGILVGGGLAVSGASYQTLFENPMVSPDILGVSAGAGFGAALAMLHDGSWSEIQFSALFFWTAGSGNCLSHQFFLWQSRNYHTGAGRSHCVQPVSGTSVCN